MLEPSKEENQSSESEVIFNSPIQGSVIGEHSLITQHFYVPNHQEAELYEQRLRLKDLEIRLDQKKLELSQAYHRMRELELELLRMQQKQHVLQLQTLRAESEVKSTREELRQTNKVTILQFVLTFASVVGIAIGTSIVTSNTSLYFGWILILASILIQGFSFSYFSFSNQRRKQN